MLTLKGKLLVSRTAALFSVLFLAGCGGFAPITQHDPISELSPPDQYSTAQRGQIVLVASLMDLFDEPALSAMVNRSLENNLDVRTAVLTMERVGVLAGLSSSGRSPTVSASLENNRTGGSAPASGSANATLTVSWELDLWGKLRERQSAAKATAGAEAEQLKAVRASVAAQVMKGWFELARASQSTRLEEERLSGLRRREDVLRRDYLAGVAKIEDLAAIEREVALSEAVRLAHVGARSDAARTLELLLGEYPDADLSEQATLPHLGSPPRAGIPANIIANRPDIRASWQLVVAADHRVSSAQKALLPNLSLTGSLGSRASEFSNLMSGATIWSLGESLTAPIFQGGRLKDEILLSRNRADQAWVSYLNLVLRAFSEVERALEQEELLRQREAQLRAALKHARTTAKVFDDRYQAGLVSVLEVLNAQNSTFDIRAQILSIRVQRMKNRVNLALALGKGA